MITGKIFGNPSVCALSSAVYSIAPVDGATGYSWSFPFSWAGTSNTNTISIIPVSNSGTITVNTTNNLGQIISARLAINVVDCKTPISKYGLSGFDGVVDVFPNTGFGKVFVDYNGGAADLGVSITNLQGQEIYSRNLRPDFKNEINLKNKPGMYFLKVYHTCGYIISMKKITVLQ